MDIERLIREMTAEEKAALMSGTDFMYTNPIPRLSIPSLRMSDGPHGLRVQKEGGDNGVSESEPATSFPTAVTTASGWNPENTRSSDLSLSSSFFLQLYQLTVFPAGARSTAIRFVDDRLVITAAHGKDGSDDA